MMSDIFLHHIPSMVLLYILKQSYILEKLHYFLQFLSRVTRDFIYVVLFSSLYENHRLSSFLLSSREASFALIYITPIGEVLKASVQILIPSLFVLSRFLSLLSVLLFSTCNPVFICKLHHTASWVSSSRYPTFVLLFLWWYLDISLL